MRVLASQNIGISTGAAPVYSGWRLRNIRDFWPFVNPSVIDGFPHTMTRKMCPCHDVIMGKKGSVMLHYVIFTGSFWRQVKYRIKPRTSLYRNLIVKELCSNYCSRHMLTYDVFITSCIRWDIARNITQLLCHMPDKFWVFEWKICARYKIEIQLWVFPWGSGGLFTILCVTVFIH